MSEMCFDDFDWDRHRDNCDCEDCQEEQNNEEELIEDKYNNFNGRNL